MTGLHHACKRGFMSIAKVLLENGSYIEAKDSMGRTPLFYALVSENITVVKVKIRILCKKKKKWLVCLFFRNFYLINARLGLETIFYF